MKHFLNTIIKFLCSIGSDKYQHFSVGTIIACVVLVICLAFNLQFPVANFISIVATLIFELVKEFILDSKADYKDVIATMLGGLMVWLSACVSFAINV